MVLAGINGSTSVPAASSQSPSPNPKCRDGRVRDQRQHEHAVDAKEFARSRWRVPAADVHSLLTCEGHEFYIRLTEAAPFAVVAEKLVICRHHVRGGRPIDYSAEGAEELRDVVDLHADRLNRHPDELAALRARIGAQYLGVGLRRKGLTNLGYALRDAGRACCEAHLEVGNLHDQGDADQTASPDLGLLPITGCSLPPTTGLFIERWILVSEISPWRRVCHSDRCSDVAQRPLGLNRPEPRKRPSNGPSGCHRVLNGDRGSELSGQQHPCSERLASSP